MNGVLFFCFFFLSTLYHQGLCEYDIILYKQMFDVCILVSIKGDVGKPGDPGDPGPKGEKVSH